MLLVGPMTEKRLIRTLAWYEHAPVDRLLGEAELTRADLTMLKELFGTAPDDLMYDCYPVQPAHVILLQRYVDVAIDLSKYAFFVECHTE